MIKKFYAFLAVLGLVAFAQPVLAEHPGSNVAPGFTAIDSHGQTHNLSDFKGKIVVLEWGNYDCPFVKKYYRNGDMQRIQKDLAGDDLVWLTIMSSADGKQGSYTAQEVNKLAVDRSASPSAILFDRDGTIGKAYEAKTTPHMFVIDKEGHIVYQGAIDSIPSVSSEDIAKADNYVVDAVAALRAGETIKVAQTKPYGCSVKY